MAVSGPVPFKRLVYVLRELQPCPDKLATIVNCFFDLRDPLKQWTADQLQHVANSAELQQPLLKAIPGKGDHPLTVRARGLLIQYELVLWIAKMNTRMLVVPPAQVYARYVLLWGMGPHGPHTSKRLRTLHQIFSVHIELGVLRLEGSRTFSSAPQIMPSSIQDSREE